MILYKTISTTILLVSLIVFIILSIKEMNKDMDRLNQLIKDKQARDTITPQSGKSPGQ